MSTRSSDLAPPRPDAAYRGAGDGEPLPAHAPATYYDRPLLKKPHWEWEVVTYLFLGGLMGGSGILVALADEDGDDWVLARSARYLSFGLSALCPTILIKHLGRPERFLNMLRIVKFKSVMSMGVWGLGAFSMAATASAAAQAAEDGYLPDVLRYVAPRAITNPLIALIGAFISGYTGVLLSATAIPLWAIGKRYIPAFSVCSGVAGACATNAAALAFTDCNERTFAKLERLELVASVAELGLLLGFKRHAGELGKPMYEGERGEKLRTWTMGLGIAAPVLLNLIPVRARWKTLLASALTLAGGYVLRETLIEAGKASADDPKAAARQPE
jgi:formate-dependent nitrite reductase membrane component NrfD